MEQVTTLKEEMIKQLSNVTVIDKDVEDYEAYIKKQDELNRLARKQSHFENCGIGSKYFDVTPESFRQDTEEQKKNFNFVMRAITDIRNGKPRTLFLCGNCGTGKTMLSAIMCKELYGTYLKSYTIDDQLRDANNYVNKKSRKDLFDYYKTLDFLVIDEVARVSTDQYKQYEMSYIFHIINDRYEDDKSTVLVSNLSSADFKKYLGEAVTDRFKENCIPLDFTDNSFRAKKRVDNGLTRCV